MNTVASVGAVETYESNLIPYGRRILCVPVEPETQTEGGIIIPESARVQSTEHVIVAIGEGEYDDVHDKHIPVRDLEIGMHILLGEYMGTECAFSLNGEQVTGSVVTPSEILAVVK